MATTLPIEILYLLEEKIGKEEAKKVSSAIIASLDVIETKANDTALQKKLELKDELTKELATKGDLREVKIELNAKIDKVRSEIQEVRSEIKEVRSEIKVHHAQIRLYFVVLLCAMIITNPTALELITKIIGIAK
jgi:gas vesicle protein